MQHKSRDTSARTCPFLHVEIELIWTQPAWRGQAHAWIAAELEHRDIAVVGPVEQPHVRPWSTVLRVPTGEGDVYFKASAPVQAFEVPLVALLAAEFGDRLPAVIAADVGRGWMLMRDAGTPLHELVAHERDLHHWQRVAKLCAELQRGAAKRMDELLGFGVPDLRLERLPALFQKLVGRADVTEDERRAFQELLPRVAELCEELHDDGIPPTLQHNDLHEHNVLLRDGRYRLFDWGDSSISHPFQTMRTTIRFAARATGSPADSPALVAIRDAYLEPWSDALPRAALLRSFAVAQAVGGVSDVLTEDRVVTAAGLRPSPDDPRAIPSMLRGLFDDL
jgi:hypothetical protein